MNHNNCIRPFILWGILGFTFLAQPVIGQEKPDVVKKQEKRWSFTLSTGGTSKGPALEIEKAMTAAGFNVSTTSGWFGGGAPVAHPFSNTGFGSQGRPWMVSASYSLKPPIRIGFLACNSPIGYTVGYQDANLYLDVQYSVFTVAPTVALSLGNTLRLGASPALFILSSWADHWPLDDDIGRTVKAGVILDLGLSVPLFKSRVFFDLGFQYRLTGTAIVGPFEVRAGGSAATMPAIRVNYNHTYLSAGIGIRL